LKFRSAAPARLRLSRRFGFRAVPDAHRL